MDQNALEIHQRCAEGAPKMFLRLMVNPKPTPTPTTDPWGYLGPQPPKKIKKNYPKWPLEFLEALNG